MKTKVLSIISFLIMAVLTQSCHDPKELVSNGDPNGILKITAKMVGDESSENNFDAEIDYDAKTIVVVFPYNYPRASDELMPENALKNVRLTASLSNNTTIEPALTVMDLTRDNYITVKNPQGVRTQFRVTGEIRKSNECEVTDFNLADGTGCIIDNEKNLIIIISGEKIDPQTATYSISHHATITPDVTTEPIDFEAPDAKVTVVAQNGVDMREYTFVKGIPGKIPFGIREGSVKLMWTKRWDEVGCTMKDVQRGIAIIDKYIVINEQGNMNSVIIDARTGNDTGMRLNLDGIPNEYNYGMTSDDAGHIIVYSKYNNKEPLFKLWVIKDLNSKPELFITGNIYGCGERVSVIGDVTRDAVIVAPGYGTCLDIFRWDVKNGDPGTMKTVKATGMTGNAWGSCDVAPTDPTNTTANYFVTGNFGYNGIHVPMLVSGTDNKVIAGGLKTTWKDDAADGENWSKTSCDYKEFNRNKYFFYNVVNGQPWGDCDMLFLMDVSGGNLTQHAVDMTATGLDINNNYGAKSIGNKGVGGGANDTRLAVSDSGFYMYAYFMFTNGYIGCIRVDCIDFNNITITD